MARYRHNLPQLSGRPFLTDGGIETTLIFLDGLDLPLFASFQLLRTEEGTERLRRYFEGYADLAKARRSGFILESPTWRASPDWAAKLGFSREELAEMNRKAIRLMQEIAEDYDSAETPFVVSGCLGPRGDGYSPTLLMSAADAQDYHSEQVEIFQRSGADMVAAITMNYPEEAIGIAQAAKAAGMPSAIAFTVETDGRLPTGHTIREAIEAVDDATGGAPAYFMINCAHPTHFESALAKGEKWVERIHGIRANASNLSHKELDEATELDPGNPVQLGRQYGDLVRRFPQFNVVGGCCGTDHRHIEQIADNCIPPQRSRAA